MAHIDPMFTDKNVWANNVDPDQTACKVQEQSDLGLLSLPFHLHLLDALLHQWNS